jgi:phosphoglycerate dehydrogenase-like enzyme
MNKGTILITDSLFIAREHEQELADAGYDIERLDVPQPTEEQLVEAIKGKVGYILGGTERLTDNVINAADTLKAIVFTGIGYKDFIPNYEYVTSKGIAIANTPDAPTYAVAEWAITMALAMNRNIFDLGRKGEKKFLTSKGIEGQRVGIIGLGRIGKQIASMISVFRPLSVHYYSRHIHPDPQHSFLDLNTLMKESDIVFVCVSKDAGENFIGTEELAAMKDGALLVSFVHRGIINEEALLAELTTGRIRAVSDSPMQNPASRDLLLNTWYCFNGSNAFNTFNEIKLCSDSATQSMIHLLETGEDKNRVN